MANGMAPVGRVAAAPMTATSSSSTSASLTAIRKTLESQAVATPSATPEPGDATDPNPNFVYKQPTCCLCEQLVWNENGYVKLRGACKCLCCPTCFCGVVALSFNCPVHGGRSAEPVFQFDAKGAARMQSARDLLLGRNFEGEVFDPTQLEELMTNFSKIKARFETDPSITFGQSCQQQLCSELFEAIQEHQPVEHLRRFGIGKLRAQELTINQWTRKYGYTFEDLLELGFDEGDFIAWDREVGFSRPEADRLSELGIELPDPQPEPD